MSPVILLAQTTPVPESAGNPIMNLLNQAHHWVLTSHDGKTLWLLCMAQITTLLVIYSPEIERSMRRALKPHNFFVRTSGFVLLHALGYGIATVFFAGMLKQIYPAIPSPWLPFVMVAIFLFIGIWAQKHKHI